MHLLARRELQRHLLHRTVRQGDDLVVVPVQPLVPFVLVGIAMDRHQMLGTSKTQGCAVVEPACGHQTSTAFGVFCHGFQRHGTFCPGLREGAPAGNLGIDRGQILHHETAPEAGSHDPGMQNILVVRQHQEIIENPALFGAQLWFRHLNSLPLFVACRDIFKLFHFTTICPYTSYSQAPKRKRAQHDSHVRYSPGIDPARRPDPD